MKHLIIFSTFFFLSTLQVYSQSDFRKGYIIRNSNDTIYGFIDYKGNKASSIKCIFKKNINSKEQEFSPNDIKAFRFIDSKYYVSKTIKPGNNEVPLFLEFLINGIIDIYYFRDKIGDHYLVDIGEDKLYELKNEKKELYKNGKRIIVESKEYIGILKYSFRKSPVISQKAEYIDLNSKSLIKIAHDYHNEVCKDDECVIYEKNLPKTKIKFGPLVGLDYGMLSATKNLSDNLYYLHNSRIDNAIHPLIGFFIKINMPSINERIYFQYEGTLSHEKLSAYFSLIEPYNGVNLINDISLAQNVFKSSGLFKYEFPGWKLRPAFIIGGFENSCFNIDYNNNIEYKHLSGDTYYTEEILKSPFNKYNFGIVLGLGITGKIFKEKLCFVDLKYKRAFGIVQGLDVNYLSLNFGFQI